MHCTDEVVGMCGRLSDRVGMWSVATRMHYCVSFLTSYLFTPCMLALHTYEHPSLRCVCVCVVVCNNCIPYLVCANV